jgi:general secretion pathway protein D
LLFWTLFLIPGLAVAQQAPTPFMDASTIEVTSNESRLTLNFGGEAPAYKIDGDGRTHVEFRLLNTRDLAVDASGAPLSTLKIGVAQGVQFRPDGQDLLLILDANAPLTISVSSSVRRRLVLTLNKAGSAGGGVSGIYGDGGGLPPSVDPPEGQNSFALVKLKYADVSEIVGLLSNGVTVKSNDSFLPLEPGFGSPGAGGNNSGPVQPQNAQDSPPLGQPVDASISVDRRLNAIWIRGSPAHIARVKAEIDAIDVPVDSVILETEFVELTETGARNVGIDFTNSAGQIGVVTLQAGQYAPSLNYPNTKNYVLSGNFQAALNAQIQSGEGRIISKPKIAAQSGSSAKIITGDALPILTSITLSGVNGVSQQVQYVNVGVTLQIAPRVSGDGFVSSHVFCVVSSVTGYSQGYPTISQRHAETSATVRDGESFVIGGLSQENVLKSRARIPVLGDIPLLGQAFNLSADSKSKTDLYIVITPHVVHHGTTEKPQELERDPR